MIYVIVLGKNKNICDKEMITELDNLKYGETSKSTPIIRGIINTKQKFGLGNNPNQILSKNCTNLEKLILKEEELLQIILIIYGVLI